MTIVPKHYDTIDSELRTQSLAHGDGLMVECKVTHPPSQIGKTVYMYVPLEDVPKLMKDLKDSAIHARSKPMGA